MTRMKFASSAIAVVLSALMLPSTRAQDSSDPFAPTLEAPPMVIPAPYTQNVTIPTRGAIPARPVAMTQPVEAGPPPVSIDPNANMAMPTGPVQQPGYVRLGAPLYPSPKPNIPVWAGATMITSPALAPHEMLYPHTYRAIYPPFYHRVKGGWIVTPFGVRSHERWELQGTQVEVKYRSQPPIWIKSMWIPPHTHGNSSHGINY